MLLLEKPSLTTMCDIDLGEETLYDNKTETNNDSDTKTFSICITPHYQPIKIGDESSISTMYLLKIHKIAPWK